MDGLKSDKMNLDFLKVFPLCDALFTLFRTGADKVFFFFSKSNNNPRLKKKKQCLHRGNVDVIFAGKWTNLRRILLPRSELQLPNPNSRFFLQYPSLIFLKVHSFRRLSSVLFSGFRFRVCKKICWVFG